jgi:hypothetical protein
VLISEAVTVKVCLYPNNLNSGVSLLKCIFYLKNLIIKISVMVILDVAAYMFVRSHSWFRGGHQLCRRHYPVILGESKLNLDIFFSQNKTPVHFVLLHLYSGSVYQRRGRHSHSRQHYRFTSRESQSSNDVSL